MENPGTFNQPSKKLPSRAIDSDKTYFNANIVRKHHVNLAPPETSYQKGISHKKQTRVWMKEVHLFWISKLRDIYIYFPKIDIW